MIPARETLTVEFKSVTAPGGFSDDDLIEALVGLANAEGGDLFLGIEDDGRVSGVTAKYTRLDGTSAFIASRTNPPLAVQAELLTVQNLPVLRLRVPKAQHLVATSHGRYLRRRLKADGEPECAPMAPHELATRLGDLRQLDYSALPLPDATLDDLDPLERARVRQFVEKFNGDRSLIDLSDADLDGALALTVQHQGRRLPTVAGLLVIGLEASIKRLLPAHEAAFQVLDADKVLVNEITRAPLLRCFERFFDLFTARITEQEVDVRGHRVGVPTMDRDALREALLNALVHRDYARLGMVQMRWERDALVISNPGGFVEGVTWANVLTVAPSPRNPLLADIIKRIGLVERTGRGVDRIFMGSARYGRRLPDYRASSGVTVALTLPGGAADLDLVRAITTHEIAAGNALPVEALIVLASLRRERRLVLADLATAMQRDETYARGILEGLVESGLVIAQGRTKGRSYLLSAHLYRETGNPAGFVRQAGFEPIQHEQMIVQYLTSHGSMKRADVIDLCHLTDNQATKLLIRLVERQVIVKSGIAKGSRYALPA